MTKDVNVYSFNDECYVYLGDYKHLLDLQKSMDKQYEELEQENQQLKSVLDEIRELLEKENIKVIEIENIKSKQSRYEDITSHLLQILDKVKE